MFSISLDAKAAGLSFFVSFHIYDFRMEEYENEKNKGNVSIMQGVFLLQKVYLYVTCKCELYRFAIHQVRIICYNKLSYLC